MPSVIKRALIIKQVPHEGPGLILDCLRALRIGYMELNAFRGEEIPKVLAPDTALIVMGGPMGAYDEDKYRFLTPELRLIEYAFKHNIPTLGICLGAQLMAKAAGARVYKGKKKEIGWYDMELIKDGERDFMFAGLPSKTKVFQWHGDTFDCPEGAVNLAKSKLFENQMLKIGKNSYALQFHLEVTEAMIHEWLIESGNVKELKGLDYIDPKKIKRETHEYSLALARTGRAVFSRFLRG
ncbi:MAG: gamma-glutamyl-gamma-aminobutyrate hydrolase family protein [Deltaproteobacteria bacterium]|nr:gamma-glutamyl-gamma-aminobutyrate hydrolase family protein [Deltaproteobacteria bacterium]